MSNWESPWRAGHMARKASMAAVSSGSMSLRWVLRSKSKVPSRKRSSTSSTLRSSAVVQMSGSTPRPFKA